MRPEEANMRVITGDLAVLPEAQQGPLQARTATLLALPISCHHTVRSVAYQAYRTLWVDEPDRAQRWKHISNMDQVFGIGRPLRTISKQVYAAAISEMNEMDIPWPVIEQHLGDFGALMTWAVGQGFVEWG
jgi:hypothetical protein